MPGNAADCGPARTVSGDRVTAERGAFVNQRVGGAGDVGANYDHLGPPGLGQLRRRPHQHM